MSYEVISTLESLKSLGMMLLERSHTFVIQNPLWTVEIVRIDSFKMVGLRLLSQVFLNSEGIIKSLIISLYGTLLLYLVTMKKVSH